jgi:Trk K+ transport system NAD-binding subunit
MKQFAIIGLGKFGRRMVDELADAGCELLVIDRDSDAVDAYKDRVGACYVADAISEEVVTRLVPPSLDAAILDLGSSIEAAILATKYLKALGISRIVAKVESDEHAEILELVGATDIIRANLEAARRVAPLLLSSRLFSYLPIGKDFVIAEVKVPAAPPAERHRPAGGSGRRVHVFRSELPPEGRRRDAPRGEGGRPPGIRTRRDSRQGRHPRRVQPAVLADP